MKRLLKPIYWALTMQLPRRIRERRIVRRLKESGLVDPNYYRGANPDLDTDNLDPVVHYVRYGAAEGRDPNSHFDSSFFIARNPDVRLPHNNPLDHFHTHGWREGRNPHPDFDVDYYLSANHDVREGGSDPLQHYLRFGRTEGRLTAPTPSPVNPLAATEPPATSQPLGPTISIRSIRRSTPERENADLALDDPIVICVAHVVPFPPRAGNHLRIYRYLLWLERRGYQVIMISSPLPGEELSEVQLEEAAGGFSNLIYCQRNGELRAAIAPHLRPLLADLEGRAAQPLPNSATPEANDELAESEATFCPDVAARTVLHIDAKLDGRAAVISHYVFSTRFMPYLRPETLKIIDTIDVFSTKPGKVEAYGVEGEMILSAAQETNMLMRGDVAMAIQPEEARELEELIPDRDVINAGIDFEVAPERFVPIRPKGQGLRILLIASGNAMNVKGLRDFLQYAWPMLQRDHPDAKLLVAGAVSAAVPPETAGVQVLGFVDSLEELYRSCHVVINPAVAGTGLKIKSVEALAEHRPLVAWPLGVEGLPPELKSLCFVASDWYQFYLHVSSCLQADDKQAYSQQQRDRIAVALSAASSYRLLGEVLDRHCCSREFGLTSHSAALGAQAVAPA